MFCPICGNEIEIIVRGYVEDPFIDGKTYNEMCFTCSSVPKMWKYDEETEELIVYSEFSQTRLHTIDEMVSDGFEKEESRQSIRAVRAAIKKSKTTRKAKKK